MVPVLDQLLFDGHCVWLANAGDGKDRHSEGLQIDGWPETAESGQLVQLSSNPCSPLCNMGQCVTAVA